MILPVIMAGGVGSRLWPLSRDSYPKQFLQLLGSDTMLQQTIKRLDGMHCESPLIICNEKHRFIAAEQLREIGITNPQLLLEPVGRNTAPAIALAAFKAQEKDSEAILLVLSADHLISDTSSFQKLILDSSVLADNGKLVTFGVVPTSPETGYGYIKRAEVAGNNSFSISEFVEKPNKERAQHYLNSGDYYWNSGMFMFRASCYLDELKKFRPDIYECCLLALKDQKQDMDFIRINSAVFEDCPSQSIDYAVMEKTDRAVVVPLSSKWSDIGGFAALWENSLKNIEGNYLLGDVITKNVKDSYITTTNKLVAVIGLDNIVIVNTDDAILVSKRDACENIKEIVENLKFNDRKELLSHPDVFKLWGNSRLIDEHLNFQVKRLTLKLNAEIEMQKHMKRAEHWIVVSGIASVIIDGNVKKLVENESVYIPANSTHSLKNIGDCELEIIEIRTGSYLGEDDITRYLNNKY